MSQTTDAEQQSAPTIETSRHPAVPLWVRIPVPFDEPQNYPRRRGIDACTGPMGRLIQYKGTLAERDKIKLAAEHLNVSYSFLMKTILMSACDAIIGAVQEHEATNTTEANSHAE